MTFFKTDLDDFNFFSEDYQSQKKIKKTAQKFSEKYEQKHEQLKCIEEKEGDNFGYSTNEK